MYNNFNRSDRGFNRSDRGFNRSDRGFTRSDRGFNRSDKGFNRSDRGFNRSDNSTKQDKSYIINNKQFPNLDTLQKEFSKPLSPKWNYTVIQDHILTDETDWENKEGWEYLKYDKNGNITKKYIDCKKQPVESKIDIKYNGSEYINNLDYILQKHSQEYKDKYPYDPEYNSEEFEWFSDSE